MAGDPATAEPTRTALGVGSMEAKGVVRPAATAASAQNGVIGGKPGSPVRETRTPGSEGGGGTSEPEPGQGADRNGATGQRPAGSIHRTRATARGRLPPACMRWSGIGERGCWLRWMRRPMRMRTSEHLGPATLPNRKIPWGNRPQEPAARQQAAEAHLQVLRSQHAMNSGPTTGCTATSTWCVRGDVAQADQTTRTRPDSRALPGSPAEPLNAKNVHSRRNRAAATAGTSRTASRARRTRDISAATRSPTTGTPGAPGTSSCRSPDDSTSWPYSAWGLVCACCFHPALLMLRESRTAPWLDHDCC